jgi:hypothetical protein
MNKLLLLTCLVLTQPLSLAFAQSVDRTERGLIAVVNLYSNAKKPFKRMLYKNESNQAASFLKHKTTKAYDSVVILSDEDATLERFLDEVKIMTSRNDIQVVDVVLDLHGQAGNSEKEPSISFINATGTPVATSLVADQLKEVSHSKLRALYSDACHGSKHNQDWMNAGFKVVAGSTRVDGNQSVDIKRFFKFWLKEKSFKEAIDHANASFRGPIMDRLIKADSTKIIKGDDTFTITSRIEGTL